MSNLRTVSLPEIVPVADPGRAFARHRAECLEAIERVLDSGWYILGREAAAFEQAFAHWLGTRHAVGVANGTDAVALALRACGVQPGDEVITVSHTAVATVAAIELIGAIPVLADIEPDTRCLDPEHLQRLASPRTRAVVPVHMAGIPARIARILEVARRNGWKVVEDCAQAHGAWVGSRMVGTFGDAAAFSFYPTKNLGAAGDGGLVATADSNLYERLVSLRQYGWSRRYISETPGTNSRLDELQAALLSIRLKYLDDENTRRRSIAARYDQALPPGVSTARPYPEALPVHHLYIVETEQREALADHLRNCGVATARHYPCAIHHQPAYRNRLRGSTDLPMTEHLYQRHLSLPMHAYLEDAEVERVCEALNSWNP